MNMEQQPGTVYDYDKQAWVVDGRYVRCCHPDSMECQCYGKLHEGEKAPEDWRWQVILRELDLNPGATEKE